MSSTTTATACCNATMETISAMCHQEQTGYVTSDYLLRGQQQPQQPLHHQTTIVDVDCRNKMVEWCYQVVDFCKFNGETVEIAISYLDRYMLSRPAGAIAMQDRNVFQLASMTCLYTAVKIHEPEAMDPRLVSTLSRGTYTPQEVEAMESSILFALQWRMNPPTSLAFVRHFMSLLPAGVLSQQMRDAVYDLTKYQTELAVRDYRFVDVKRSTVAYSALMNSLESIGLDDKTLGYIGYLLAQSIAANCNDQHILNVQQCLYQAVLNQPAAWSIIGTTQQGGESSRSVKPGVSRRSSFEVSPRSSTTM